MTSSTLDLEVLKHFCHNQTPHPHLRCQGDAGRDRAVYWEAQEKLRLCLNLATIGSRYFAVLHLMKCPSLLLDLFLRTGTKIELIHI